ncbi:transmembrane protein 131-like isoform X2 [Lingula anatina]|uniref:Transmembrane protein 131-like isoform X2 n=1 Tax=Lingula anatina TaxID=7574 RepID=A0A1S3K829_LINAN|nr:transmembrane protein 131-like isoform X2 [Lingula anatina]|eukprot:XP_013418594.1 transmembrane protein 131-like isoform X2 [Lingula anatina]
MAGSERGEIVLEFLNILLFLNVFTSNTQGIQGFDSHGQVFIQTDNELRYMVDGPHLPNVPGGEFPDINSLQESSLPSSPIRFDPPMLDFDEHAVGMPHMETVTVHNPDTINSLHLLSISGSTLHFHCSFFQDKLVPPGGNTTFEVVFLARQVGNVENTLYIHTSQGTFKYQVFGVGIPNPYRLRPFLGARVPLNSSFSPLIHMHNPHSTALQVVEMYASGGDLHLELPTGEKEAPKNLWEIPPYETKPVMRASFVGRNENNHTAFIRIKTSKDEKKQMLVLPVEVEVSSAPGLYCPYELLDFGILRTHDSPRSLRLNLVNSGTKAVHIQSVSLFPPNDAVSIDFRPIKIQPDVLQPTTVATITYTASKGLNPKQYSGRILVKSKNNHHRLYIPYEAEVLHGSLVYELASTEFYVGSKKSPPKNVTVSLPLTNTFNFTLVIYNVTLPPNIREYFTVLNFTHPMLVPPRETVVPFQLKFHPNSSDLHFTGPVRVYTNASVFFIPLRVYNGKLKVIHHRPEVFKGQLDFGVMGVGDRRKLTFTLRNDNPIDVTIYEFSSNMLRTTVELLGVEKGNGTALTREHNVSEIDTSPLVLKPYHFAVFRVNLHAPDEEGSYAAEVLIYTNFETQYIPLTLMTVEGGLMAVPEVLMFENAFPGKVLSQDFRINSTFDGVIEAGEVIFIPEDSRFHYERANVKPLWIYYHDHNIIGKLSFDVRQGCEEDCYVGLPTHTPAGHQWLLGLTLDREVTDTDQYLYTKLQQKWENVGSIEKNPFNVTIQLNTDYVRGFLFPAQVQFSWPTLIEDNFESDYDRVLRFPLTQVGNKSDIFFMVVNPSDVPVIIQVLPLSLYPNPQVLLDMLSSTFSDHLSDYVETDDQDIFTLENLELYDKRPDNAVPEMRQWVTDYFGVKPHKHTIATILNGRGGVRCLAGFSPKDDSIRSTLIVIRNNLTIIDAIVVEGRGSYGQLKFSGRKPGSPNPLSFEMTEKVLSGCEKPWKPSRTIPPSFTVKRTFTTRNSGELPVYVHGFSINDEPCQGYGFKVLNCEGFELKPNQTKKIDIAFSPDFTMSRVRRLLKIHSSLGDTINFTLQATIPASMLTKCSAALPRPSWEPIIYYSTVCLMGFLTFCIFVASYFEADRIFTTDLLRRQKAVNASSQLHDKSKIFDLKNIAVPRQQEKSIPGPQLLGSKSIPEMGNGHADLKRKKDPTPSISISSIFCRSTSRQNSSEPPAKQPTYERQSSSGECGKTTTTAATQSSTTQQLNNLKLHPAEKNTSYATASEANPAEKAPQQSSTVNSKSKKKASKQNVNDISTVENGYIHGEKKQAKSEPVSNSASVPANSAASPPSVTSASKNTEQEQKASNDKEKVQAEKVKKLVPSSSGNSVNHLDSFEVPEVHIVAENLNEENSGKKEAKPRPKRKSKTAQRREDKERRQKEKAKRKDSNTSPVSPSPTSSPATVEDYKDKDDTSSTTTESSGGDADDKASSTRDSTPEPLLKKTKKSKNKGKKNKEVMAEEQTGEDDFILTSKSKAHTRIKVDPKNAFGGNIHRPSTIELPYTTKLEEEERAAIREEPTSPHALAADIATKCLKKNIKGTDKQAKQAKGSIIESHLTGGDPDSPWSGKDSPPPLWDQPIPIPSTGDLSELAEQTENFALRHGKQLLGSPDHLSSSSRSSSYSSVVSSSSSSNNNDSNHARKQAIKKPTPFNPLANPFDYSAIMASKAAAAGLIPGKAVSAVGGQQNPSLPQMTSPSTTLTSRVSPWSPSMGTGQELGASSLFVLPSIHENSMNSQSKVSPVDSFSQPTTHTYGLGDGSSFLQPPSTSGSMFGGQENMTMMQRLQQERRQRLAEYQQKLLQGEDWPGFDINPVQAESLWDSTCAPSETWSPLAETPAGETWPTVAESPPRVQASLWSDIPTTISTSDTSSWSPHSAPGIWSGAATSGDTGSPSLLNGAGGSLLGPAGSGSASLLSGSANSPLSGLGSVNTTAAENEQGVQDVGSFDPFNTLSSIWAPGGTSGWSFGPNKTEDE